jgi:hypothetical protein
VCRSNKYRPTRGVDKRACHSMICNVNTSKWALRTRRIGGTTRKGYKCIVDILEGRGPKRQRYGHGRPVTPRSFCRQLYHIDAQNEPPQSATAQKCMSWRRDTKSVQANKLKRGGRSTSVVELLIHSPHCFRAAAPAPARKDHPARRSLRAEQTLLSDLLGVARTQKT